MKKTHSLYCCCYCSQNYCPLQTSPRRCSIAAVNSTVSTWWAHLWQLRYLWPWCKGTSNKKDVYIFKSLCFCVWVIAEFLWVKSTDVYIRQSSVKRQEAKRLRGWYQWLLNGDFLIGQQEPNMWPGTGDTVVIVTLHLSLQIFSLSLYTFDSNTVVKDALKKNPFCEQQSTSIFVLQKLCPYLWCCLWSDHTFWKNTLNSILTLCCPLPWKHSLWITTTTTAWLSLPSHLYAPTNDSISTHNSIIVPEKTDRKMLRP